MNNYIGIDISLNSTAVYIESDLGKKIICATNKKDNNIYIKELDRYGVLFFNKEREKSDDYSTNEILKINHFDYIASKLSEEIKNHIDLNKKTYCQIEGYSFSKNTSSILDIVSFSTLIRTYLLKSIDNIEMSIISPNTLKLEACKISYSPIDIGIKKPKIVYMNGDGMMGGSFTKKEMYKAILDSGLDFPIKEMLIDYKHLTERNKIPNPIEDIIDAIFATKIKINQIEKG
jgi:hypothetical protein